MSTSSHCPECGDLLAAYSPLGLCPRCILRLGMANPAGGVSAEGRDHNSQSQYTTAELKGLLPDLEVMEPLGHGGMGVVCKARQVKLDRPVAVKLIRPEVSDHPAFFDRFSREARSMARLNHPNIVTIFDYGEAGGIFHIVMELVEGINLRTMIDRGALEAKLVLVIAMQICDALRYAHERGVVHRDIKPENVLIDRVRGVKLVDFGLAKLVSPGSKEGWSSTRHVMGTPFYMAPEQIERPREVDHRADIYALGVLLYEMLAGIVPYGRYEPLSEKAGCEDEFDEIVDKALARRPSDRYDSVDELRHDLAEVAEDHYELPDMASILAETLGQAVDEKAGSDREFTVDWSWLSNFAAWISRRKPHSESQDELG
jgi:serine/threonine protein kinase